MYYVPAVSENMDSINPLPIVAIIGRPNVGKSSLFNRLIGKRHAITSDIAGTTRDRIYYRTEFQEQPAILIDTGGLEYGKKENIEADVKIQLNIAISEADLIIFLTDANEGLTIEDYQAADILRKSGKQIIFVGNKIDHKNAIHNEPDYLELGFGEPIMISAYHNINVGELENSISEFLRKNFPANPIENIKQGLINLSFVGRPNAGKSSLVNALLGKSKVIVSDIPGTTRDAIDTEFTWENHNFNLIDTAGIRRRGRIERGLEKISTFRSLEAIERSDVVCLVLDFSEGIRKQDQHIASYVLEANKGLILLVNKTDLMDDRNEEENRIIRILRSKFDFLPWAPVIFTSAIKKSNFYKILETSLQIYSERHKQLDDDELKGFIQEVTHKHLPPAVSNKLPKFFSLKQTGINPPTFVYKINNPDLVHFSYRRYLENELRKKYGFNGTSIRVIYSAK